MAVDIERQASLSRSLAYRADLLSMAETWCHLAQQALRQAYRDTKIQRQRWKADHDIAR